MNIQWGLWWCFGGLVGLFGWLVNKYIQIGKQGKCDLRGKFYLPIEPLQKSKIQIIIIFKNNVQIIIIFKNPDFLVGITYKHLFVMNVKKSPSFSLEHGQGYFTINNCYRLGETQLCASSIHHRLKSHQNLIKISSKDSPNLLKSKHSFTTLSPLSRHYFTTLLLLSQPTILPPSIHPLTIIPPFSHHLPTQLTSSFI